MYVVKESRDLLTDFIVNIESDKDSHAWARPLRLSRLYQLAITDQFYFLSAKKFPQFG